MMMEGVGVGGSSLEYREMVVGFSSSSSLNWLQWYLYFISITIIIIKIVLNEIKSFFLHLY
jgi:hypothetical protein